MASSKRQTTMAKLNRERKQEKKAARLAAAEAGLYDPETGEDIIPPRGEVDDETDDAETAESERSTDPT